MGKLCGVCNYQVKFYNQKEFAMSNLEKMAEALIAGNIAEVVNLTNAAVAAGEAAVDISLDSSVPSAYVVSASQLGDGCETCRARSALSASPRQRLVDCCSRA